MRTNSLFSLFLLFIGISVAFAQDDHSHGHDHNHDHDHESSTNYFKKPFNLDVKAIHKQLANKQSSITLPYLSSEIPFEVEEFKFYSGDTNPVPGLRAFRLVSKADENLQGRMVVGPHGINLNYLEHGRSYRIFYEHEDGATPYYEEYGYDLNTRRKISCEQGLHGEAESVNPVVNLLEETRELEGSMKRQFGNHRRRFRVAIVCTGEYYQRNGGSPSAAKQRATENLIDISMIFERELNVFMVLADGSPRADYSDPSSDPFDGSADPDAANSEVRKRWDNDEYDIGHGLHTMTSGGSGRAGVGVVCSDGRKGVGWSGFNGNTSTQWISLAAHEFGHQFGSPHTFSGDGSNCAGDQFPDNNAYEMASGVTLMSYNGICGAEWNIGNNTVSDSDDTVYDYLHAGSLNFITNHLNSETAENCNRSEWDENANNEPVADANPCGAKYMLPSNTPFFLKGDATDADGDYLTYSWEQFDRADRSVQGNTGNAAATSATGPLFRCYPPNGNNERHIPRRSNQLDDRYENPYEVLPRQKRSITMRMIVRDNNPGGGAIDWDDVRINVIRDDFKMTAPSGGDPVIAGGDIRVEWEGAEGLCERAEVRLSTDGGNSFPIVLKSNIAFSKGSEVVTLPNNLPAGSQARFQVRCADYECFAFYQISDGNSEIQAASCNTAESGICDTDYLSVDYRSPLLNFGKLGAIGSPTHLYEGSIINASPEMRTTVFNNSRTDCRTLTVDPNPFHAIQVTPARSGRYYFEFADVNTTANNLVEVYSIFEKDGFNPSSPCSSFVGSNSTSSGGSYVDQFYMRVNLEACKEYFLVAQPTKNNAQSIKIKMEGSGDILSAEQDELNTNLTYVALDLNRGVITFENGNADFELLPPGTYEIYSVSYDGVSPSSFIGMTINELAFSDDCVHVSSNFKPVEISSACAITDLQTSISSPCSSVDNTYSVNLSFGVDLGPSTGMVIINGQSFPLSGGTNNVTLTGLIADGQPVDLDFSFSADDGCQKILFDVLTAPENCCNISFNLGNQDKCVGEDAVLNAGTDGDSYQWFFDDDLLSETSNTLTATEGGIYSVIVTSGQCSKPEQTSVSFNTPPIVDIITPDSIGCEGDRIRIRTISDNWDSIAWTIDGVVEEDFINERTPLATKEGLYEIQAFNGGCMRSDVMNIELLESSSFGLGADQTQCIGTPVFLDTQEPDLTYVWERLFATPSIQTGNSSTFTVNEEGFYVAYGTNNLGCTSSDTVRIRYEELDPEGLYLGEDQEDCEGDLFRFRVDFSPVNWYKDGELIVGFNANTFDVTESGTYIVEQFITEDCVARDTAEILINPKPELELGPNMSFCTGTTIDTCLYAGPDFVFSYTWSLDGGDTGNNRGKQSVTEPGLYNVFVRNPDTRCFIRDEVVVEFTDSPTIEIASAPVAMCPGGPGRIIAESSTVGISWYLDGVLTDFSESRIDITEPGTYRAVVGEGQSCEASAEVTILPDIVPEVDLPELISACEGADVELNAGPETWIYTWYSASLPSVILSRLNTFTVPQQGTYVVTASNDICTTLDTVAVVITPSPFLTLPGDQSFCMGDTESITASTNADVIKWYNGTQVLPSTGRTIEITTAGTYRAVALEGQECEVSDEIVIEFNSPPSGGITDVEACEGQAAVFVAGDDSEYGYTWQVNGMPFTNSGGTLSLQSTDILGLSGEVSVLIKNLTNDCSITSTAMVNFQAGAPVMIDAEEPFCEGTSVLIEASGNTNDLTWYRNGIEQSETSSTFEATRDGKYLVVAGSGECAQSDSISIVFGELPEIFIKDQTLCTGETATFTAGPDGAYTYQWFFNGALQSSNTGSLMLTTPGTVRVVATNDNGCVVEMEAELAFTADPMFRIVDAEDDICYGSPARIRTFTTENSIRWFFNGVELDQTGDRIEVLEPGTYVGIAGQGDCEVTDEVEVTFLDSPDIELNDQSKCSTETATFVAGADGAYQYSWKVDGVDQANTSGTLVLTSNDVLDNTAEIEVTAKFLNAECEITLTAILEFIDTPEVMINPVGDFCDGNPVTITTTTNVSSLSWTRDGQTLMETGTTLEVTQGGTYVAMAGSGSCATMDEITLVAADSPDVMIDSQSLCQGQEAVFTAGADGAYLYSWFINDQLITNTSGTLTLTEGDITGNTADIKVVAKNNNDDCSGESSTTLEFIESPALEINEPEAFCIGSKGTLTTNTENVTTLSWFLNGMPLMQDGLEIEVEDEGLYLAIAGSGPCAVRDSVDVSFKSAPEVELMSQSPCQGEEAVFMAGPDGGFEYSWFINDQAVTNTSGTLVVTEADITTSPATIKVIVKNNDDECSTEAETTVEFISSPSLEILELEGFCKGSPGTIRTTTDNVTTLNWFLDGMPIQADGLEIEVEDEGLYLAIAGSGPCAVRDSVDVTFADSPDVMISDVSKCAGEDAVFTAGPDDAYDYVWYLDGVDQMNSLGSLTVTAMDIANNVGMVRVVATNKNDDCETESIATIEFIETPELSISELPDFCDGTPSTIMTETNVSSLRWFIDGDEQTETTPDLEATVGGLYLAIAGNGECAVRDSVLVEFSDSPEIMISDMSQCAGEVATFTAGADDAYDYEWFLNGAPQMGDLGSLTLTSADVTGGPGLVTVIATNKDDNCSTSQDAMVEFIDTPELEIDEPDAFCIGSSGTLTTNTNVNSLRWFLDGEEQMSTTTDLEITEGGLYLAIAGEGQCAIRDSVNVTFDDAPEIDLSSIVKCAGEDAVFVAGPDGAYDYEWILDGQMVTNTTGSLTVTAADIAGDQATVEVTARLANSDCSTTLSAMVEFIQAPELSINQPDDFCEGEMATLTTMTNVGTLRWFLNGVELTDETTDISVEASGTYLAIAGDGQCAVRDSIDLSFAPSPVISLTGDMDACEGDITVLTLDSDTNGDVIWSRNGAVIPNESGLTLDITEDGTYTAAISNTSNCTSEEMIEIAYYDLAAADITDLPSGICEGVAFEVVADSDGDFFEWIDDATGDVVGTEISQEFDSSGDYTFIAYNLIGCPTEFPFSLDFRPAPPVDLGGDQKYCEGETAELSIPQMANVEYEWSRDGTTLPDDGNSISITEGGVYKLVATNDIDCEGSDEVIIAFVPTPSLLTETDVSFCTGSEATLSVMTDAPIITWELGGQVIDQNVESTDVSLGGTYKVTVETPEGCSAEENIIVTEISVDDLDFPDIELCPRDDPQVYTITGDFDTYSWTGAVTGSSSSISIPYKTVTETTTEIVNVTAAKGECSSSASFEVTYYPPIMITVEDDMPSICIGGSRQLVVGGGSNYSWSDPNGSLSATDIPNPIASPTETTTYEVMIGDEFCPNNFETVSITVTVNPLPEADAGPDKTTIPNESVNLDASGGTSYMWDNTDLINGSSTIPDPEVLITELTTFTVTVTDDNGCSDTDSADVDIVNDPKEVVNIIDAFSPNSDGQNDFLEFDGLELFPENNLTVFNRWGNIVYEKRGYQRDELRWDGTRNGKPLPAATYYYILEFADFKVKNSVSIIRD